ncbi:TPA: hypothetical protein I8Y81_001832 [Legionella pneumophila]|nr:hypothetical protein [Legionella pneumophila]
MIPAYSGWVNILLTNSKFTVFPFVGSFFSIRNVLTSFCECNVPLAKPSIASLIMDASGSIGSIILPSSGCAMNLYPVGG